MTRIVIIEEHVLFREGLKCLLEEETNLSIVGDAAEGTAGIRLVENVKPDVVLLGLMLSTGPHGLEVLRRLRSTSKLLVVEMRTDEAFVIEAFLNGADGYVVKRDTFLELLSAIKSVLDDQRFISPRLNPRRILKALERERRRARNSNGSRPRLTTREHEVLQLSAEGLTSNQTAGRLSISPRTVEMHRANLMQKLGLHSCADLVRFAIRNRVIPA